ncbi:histidine phosphatase family protein [Rhodococcus sp. 1168]|uniref:histidine phosphatase family protein n=1 Tax=Rhodococcus sp. 1168 TaxID=2018041 RepID=UPI001592F59C|nr:histidine phosphatase family protein [Rhodococcus sp. 1168]
MRHAETALNAANKFQSRLDPPLDERGRRAALAATLELPAQAWGAVYASPMVRSCHTAQIVGQSQRHPTTLTELIERDLGVLDGLDKAGYARLDPEGMNRLLGDANYAPAGGETRTAVRWRLASAIVQIHREHNATSKPVLAVTHGGVLRELLASAPSVSNDLIGTCGAVSVHVALSGGRDLSLRLENIGSTVADCHRTWTSTGTETILPRPEMTLVPGTVADQPKGLLP